MDNKMTNELFKFKIGDLVTWSNYYSARRDAEKGLMAIVVDRRLRTRDEPCDTPVYKLCWINAKNISIDVSRYYSELIAGKHWLNERYIRKVRKENER